MAYDMTMGNRAKEIKLQKNELREQYREKRAALPPEEKLRRDAELTRKFLSSASFRYYDTFLLYAARDGEADVRGIAEAALAAGKKVAYPRCAAEEHEMTFHYVSSLDDLTPGTYGIKEPPEDAPVFDPKSSGAVCLVPGFVFDRRGYRIGYGKGYYDRYLSAFCGVSTGVVYSDFIVPSLPCGKYDLHTDMLLSEKGVRTVAEN